MCGKVQRRIQKFFEGGVLKFFVWTRKFRGVFGIFLLKKPSKLEKFPKKGRPPKTLPSIRPGKVLVR